jgi:hypothetical protein
MAKKKTQKFELFVNNNYAAETLVSIGLYNTEDEITTAIRDYAIENDVHVNTWLLTEELDGSRWVDVGHPRIRFMYKVPKEPITEEETKTIETLEEPTDVVTAETKDDVWEK